MGSKIQGDKTMTKQELAIQMWQEIRVQLPEWHKHVIGHIYQKCDIHYKIRQFTAHFLAVRGLHWNRSNWLCNRYYDYGNRNNICSKCPLRSCSPVDHSTAWARLGDTFISLEGRLKACDEIIKAISSEPLKEELYAQSNCTQTKQED